MKHKISVLAILLALSILGPTVAEAAWWSPLSWIKRGPTAATSTSVKNAKTAPIQTAAKKPVAGYKNATSNPSSVPNNTDSACPDAYAPVCGVRNGVRITYGNYCKLQRAGAQYFTGSACPSEAAPSDQATTTNATTTPNCFRAAGMDVNYPPLDPNCPTTTRSTTTDATVCPANYDPMCGLLNGQYVTYNNYCNLRLAGAQYFTGGRCPTQATSTGSANRGGGTANNTGTTGNGKCSQAYKPVCGRDNVTYRNLCLAVQAGATISHAGVCPTVRPGNGGASSSSSQNSNGSSASSSNSGGRRENECFNQNALPDLVVKSGSVSYRPIPLKAGNDIVFKALILNTGPDYGVWRSQNVSTGSCGDSTAIVHIDYGNNGSWDYENRNDMGPLRHNHTSYKVWSDPWEAVAGTHKFELCADGDRQVPETDEGNNCHREVITVSP